MKTDIAQILSLAKDDYIWGNHSYLMQASCSRLFATLLIRKAIKTRWVTFPTICILLYSNLIKSTKLTISLNDLRLRNCYIRYLHSNILLLFTWPWAGNKTCGGRFFVYLDFLSYFIYYKMSVSF